MADRQEEFIDMKSLPSGLYLIKIDQKIQTYQLVLENFQNRLPNFNPHFLEKVSCKLEKMCRKLPIDYLSSRN